MNETVPLVNPQANQRKIRLNLKSILILTVLAYFAYTYVINPIIRTINDRNFKSCLNDCVSNATSCRGSCNIQLEECRQSCPAEDLGCKKKCDKYFNLACYSPCEDNGFKCFNKCKLKYNIV
ncbi:hypothetical protein CONCODRAFT_20735 [Conidiobolus coronatus NRRL 28638]|uniref:Transmembrane protein n=1 Tax=Conidiobolus coronatus (strain ATCC 28846 / CBS 209.66 / NRRL 28638) TaxID=796925 RepID=A0A137NRR1_CONC2|nr:hypothetical protein CONCODRAFT_20735 [Conidiobolus coronatus NRRL 28638]|eukprot:KXN65414.1 hypothetical protein CONCODRAFT_20735 [Conidiobolus coronatus NRRL 28638]